MITKTLSLGLLTLGGLAIAPSAWANLPESEAEHLAGSVDPMPQSVTPFTPKDLLSNASPLVPAALTVDSRIAQAEAAEPAAIKDVQVSLTPAGLNIVLVSDQPLSAGASRVEGNALITEIPSATLNLADEAAAEQFSPAEGIALVQVSSLPEGGVRVAITGTNAPPEAETVANAQSLVFTVTPAAAAGIEPSAPIRILATGEQDSEDYYVPRASTATRTETPILEIPQSVQVIPRAVIEDQQAIRLDEALRNLSGVVSGGRDLGRGTSFSIRGFQDVPVLRNGFRQFGAGNTFPETANLEQIEVLRGPASVLFGEIRPGGVINLVTKRPLSEPFYNVQLQAGNQGLLRPSIDVSGPLTDDERLLYRLNAVYQTGGDFQAADTDVSRFFISPVLAYAISDHTDLTLELEYLNDQRPPAFGIPARGEGIADIPFDQISNEPDDVAEEEYFNIGYDLEHRFSDRWSLRNGFRYARQDGLLNVAFPFELDEDTSILTRFWAVQPESSESFTLQTNLTGEFMTGSIGHTLLLGVDLNRTDSDFNTDIRLDPSTPLPLDIFNPVYGQFPRPASEDLPILVDQTNKTNRLGIFAQDQIDLLDNLVLLAGLRFDVVDQTITTKPTEFDPSRSEVSQNESALTPRIGLVYQPVPDVSLYASYSQVFAPSVEETTTVEGDPLGFEDGEGFELGVKTELLQGDLSGGLTYFNITRRNIATEDPDNPFFFIATGEQHSQGVELDMTGEILPGWNVLASYAFIDAEITEDDNFDAGNRLPSAPKHSANLWTTYEIQSGDLRGLGFGLGFNFVGVRAGDLANSFELDDYFLVNAAVSYQKDNWRAALNFRNLFDVDYIADTSSPVRVRGNDPGAPFTVIGSISVTF